MMMPDSTQSPNGPVLTEVPIFLHAESRCEERYAVNEDLRLSKSSTLSSSDGSDNNNDNGGGQPTISLGEGDWKSHAQGYASVSTPTQPSSNTDGHDRGNFNVLLQTHAHAENPCIMCVRLISSSSSDMNMDNGNHIKSIELDMSSLMVEKGTEIKTPIRGRSSGRSTSIMGTPIKTCTFHERHVSDDGSNAYSYWKIVSIDAAGNILHLKLDGHTLEPQADTVHIVSTSTLLRDILVDSQRSYYRDRQYHQLTSSQVAFLDSNRLVVAMASCIVCLSLSHQKIVQWAPSRCLETKLQDSKQSGFSQILKNAGGLLVGKSSIEMMEEQLEKEEMMMNGTEQERLLMQNRSIAEEMPSTAALCVLHDTTISHFNEDSDVMDMTDDDEGISSTIQNTARAVCSLHSDGTVRLWHLPVTANNKIGQRTSIYPLRMSFLHHELDVSLNGNDDTMILPPSHIWSRDDDAVSMSSYVYREKTDESNEANEELKFMVCVHIDTDDDIPSMQSQSPCHVSLFAGDLDDTSKTTLTVEGREYSYQRHERKVLEVPEDVKTLISMNFLSNQSGRAKISKATIQLELEVLFQTITSSSNDPLTYGAGERNSSSASKMTNTEVQMAVYKVLNTSSPTRLSLHHTFDLSAKREREEMMKRCHAFAQEGIEAYLDENGEEKDPLKSEIKRVETWYMNCLFRSPFNLMRCGGAEQSHYVRRALKMLVPTHLSDSNDFTSRSIEATTLSLMREWIKLDETPAVPYEGMSREVSPSPQPSPKEEYGSDEESLPATSIYHDFSNRDTPSETKATLPSLKMLGNGNDDDAMDFDAENDSVEMILSYVHDKWMKLISSVWKEEAKIRFPLIHHPNSLTSCVGDPSILVRSGVTSKLLISVPTKPSSPTQSKEHCTMKLDTLALHLLDQISEYTEKVGDNDYLSSFEMQVGDMISKAKLLFNGSHEMFTVFPEQTRTFSAMALDMSAFESEVSTLVQLLTRDDIRRWLSTAPSPSTIDTLQLSPGLPSHLKLDKVGVRSSESTSPTRNTSSLAACASIVVRQYVESMRKVTFARYLLVSCMISDHMELFECQDINDSLRNYLYLSTLGWVNSQMHRNKGLQKAKATKVQFISDRQTISSTQKGQPEVYQKQNSILFLHLLQMARDAMDSSSLTYSVTHLARAYVDQKLVRKGSDAIENEGILPDSLDESGNLYLRLLAPSIVFPPDVSDWNGINRRKEAAADCLLSVLGTLSKKKEIDPNIYLQMWKNASNLLIKSCSEGSSSINTRCDEILRALASGLNGKLDLGENIPQEVLSSLLQSIVDPSSSVVQKDVVALSEMESVQKLFLPYIAFAQSGRIDPITLILQNFDPIDSFAHLQHLVLILLNISNMLRRVAVLERHVLLTMNACDDNEMKSAITEVLHSAITDVIEFINGNFTADMIGGYILEYSALWSSAFHYCIRGLRWDDAFKACISNPIKERREKNFCRLALSMADKGALGILIQKVLDVKKSQYRKADAGGPSAIGLNEFGVDMNFYELMVKAFSDAINDNPDFDAHQGYGPNNQKANYVSCLYATHAVRGEWRRSCEAIEHYGSEDSFITDTEMEDTSGDTSVTAEDAEDYGKKKVINALSLSYLVSSQVINLEEDQQHRFIISKKYQSNPSEPHFLRMIEKNMTKDEVEMDMGGGSDDTGIFLSEKDLSIRAAKLMALRTLDLDPLSSDSLEEILQYSNPQIIDTLARLGYYSQAIFLAQQKDKEMRGAKPGGCDVVANAMSHICCKYIAPIATIQPTITNGTNLSLSEDIVVQRPSFNQMYSQSHSFPLQSSKESWRSRSQNSLILKQNATMDILRRLVVDHSSPSNTLATDVADALLGMDGLKRKLPQWLTDTLIPNRNASQSLFANIGKSSEPKGSNPNALLQLLTHYGLYVQACEVVCTVFLENHESRKTEAVSRLPEKGQCDFVPYDSIDILFALIEEEIQVCSMDRRSQLESARDRMEKALEMHFNLMKASELGMLSARALLT